MSVCENLHEKILLFNDLDTEEQAEILKHAEGCESCREKLQSIQVITNSLQHHQDAHAVSDDMLENYSMHIASPGEPDIDGFGISKEEIDIVRSHLEKCTRCRRRVERMQLEFHEIEAQLENSEIAGLSIGGTAINNETVESGQKGRFVEPKPKVKHFDPQFIVRYSMAAAVLLAALYGGLWYVGNTSLPRTYEAASIVGFEDALNNSTRSAGGEVTAFFTGMRAVKDAHQTTFGLFPHYDQAQAEIAIKNLTAAFQASKKPVERAEIAFFLAKAHLMKEDVQNAKRWLVAAHLQNVANYREDCEALLKVLSPMQ